ncbi:MAG: phage tail sheath subtilisin-like domain-containing protein [Marinirhabdus sp.]|nr:phage tail sheath subtilisin-like domain-containing protein [Marinirhabdus sp.]
MTKKLKTPGVYIQELDAFGNAVVPVPTAVPVFIGYTEQTEKDGENLVLLPKKMNSLAAFKYVYEEQDDTAPPHPTFAISTTQPPHLPDDISKFHFENTDYYLQPSTPQFRLHSAVRHFYLNGGGSCFIVSVGICNGAIDKADLIAGIDAIETLSEASLVVVPDAVTLSSGTLNDSLENRYAAAYDVQNYVINHCGTLRNRFAILDIPGGYSDTLVQLTSIDAFRNRIQSTDPKYMEYAAAYYPWLHTSLYSSNDISPIRFAAESHALLASLLQHELQQVPSNLDANGELKPNIKNSLSYFSKTSNTAIDALDPTTVHATLMYMSPLYNRIIDTLLKQINLLPPSAAMAGLYGVVDTNYGVWKAPANIGVQGVIAPTLAIDTTTQEDLNVPLSGKAICAIRRFAGRGNLVWGARTLDGNSNDYRYINVRRTIIFIEQSIQGALKNYVNAPNNAATWTNLKSVIGNFLTSLWKQGGLMGLKPDEAFSVAVGLGSTMTHDDIQIGILRISVHVAVLRPAEFIVLIFQQQLQTN